MESSAVKNINESFQIRLRRIEERIAKADDDGLRARWEFGQEILMQRGEKILPRGLLDEVSAEQGVSRSEIKRRVQFAERFPTESQLAHACASWPTWHQMVAEGLVGKRTKPLIGPSALSKREQSRTRIYDLIDEHKGRRFSPLEWRNRFGGGATHALSFIPWANVVWGEDNKVQLDVDEELRAICDGRIARPALDGFSIGAFLRHMRVEITRRRKENHDERMKRKWNPEAVNSLGQKRLLDWIEAELDRVPDLPSPEIRG